MEGLTLIPTTEGLNLIKQNIEDTIKYATLLDENKQEIKTYEFFSIFYDKDGVLTALFEVPVEENLTKETHYIQIKTKDNTVISEGQTPPITFVKGVGGTQTIKFAVSGEPAQIIYKANDYITFEEFTQLIQPAIIALTERITALENKLIEKQIITEV